MLSFQPFAGSGTLTLRAMTVAAGIVSNDGMSTVWTAFHMAAQLCLAAFDDGRHNLHLTKADMTLIGLRPSRTMLTENIRNLQIDRHEDVSATR